MTTVPVYERIVARIFSRIGCIEPFTFRLSAASLKSIEVKGKSGDILFASNSFDCFIFARQNGPSLVAVLGHEIALAPADLAKEGDFNGVVLKLFEVTIELEFVRDNGVCP